LRFSATPPPQSNPGQTQETPAMIQQYDNAVQEPLQHFLTLSSKIGGDTDAMVSIVIRVAKCQKCQSSTLGIVHQNLNLRMQEIFKKMRKKVCEFKIFASQAKNLTFFLHHMQNFHDSSVSSVLWLQCSTFCVLLTEFSRK
jgi:hypothetical protein